MSKPPKKPKPEEVETESDEKREDEILRRMLNTPPKPHKPLAKKASPKSSHGKRKKDA